MTERTQTSAVECDLDRHAIIQVLSDLRRLPLGALAFVRLSISISPAPWAGAAKAAPSWAFCPARPAAGSSS